MDDASTQQNIAPSLTRIFTKKNKLNCNFHRSPRIWNLFDMHLYLQFNIGIEMQRFRPKSGSVLESVSTLCHLLCPHGHTHNSVSELAVGEFLTNERINIETPSTMHLLALKKTLLYVIPIISPPGSFEGILLTSQVSCPAIQYTKKQFLNARLAVGDKFRLVGIAFPSTWTNHLAYDIFPWKQLSQQQSPLRYQSVSIQLTGVNGLHALHSNHISWADMYLIDLNHYEDTELFNRINQILVICIGDVFLEAASIMAYYSVHHPSSKLPMIKRISPYNNQKYLPRLDAVFPFRIDPTFTMSEYECLQMSFNWRVYDEIRLFGLDAPSVVDRLSRLRYAKEQSLQARINQKNQRYQRLLLTRGEKIARERYPHFFDNTDRRAIFNRTNRFSMTKLPTEQQKEVNILLEKEIKAQNALLTNQCDHIIHIQQLHAAHISGSDQATLTAFSAVEPFINHQLANVDDMHSCKLCSYPLLCQHELEFHSTLQSVDYSNETVDQAYLMRQRIINKYRSINNHRTGNEDTEVGFTYYCKLCGAELGKSDDVIQASLRVKDQSAISEDAAPLLDSIYSAIAHIVKHNMNQSIVPSTHRTVTKFIFNLIKEEVKSHVERAKKLQNAHIDLFVRYITFVYACSSLIAIKVSKLKSSAKVLIQRQQDAQNEEEASGGASAPQASDIKTDFVTAFKILQSNAAFKRIGITEANAKALLIHAFKTINRELSNDEVQLKPSTAVERSRTNLAANPVARYAMRMYKRSHRKIAEDPLLAIGIDFSKLATTGAQVKEQKAAIGVFSNIYKPHVKKNNSEIENYIINSYRSFIDALDAGGVPNKSSAQSFESKRTTALVKLRTTPDLPLPNANSRMFQFTLHNYQIGYCDDTGQPHRWRATTDKNGLKYVCVACNRDKDSVDTNVDSSNALIETKLQEMMLVRAFFELYTLSCPVKDAHEYKDGDACIRCGVQTSQIIAMDSAYYKKYSNTFSEFRRRVTNHLLESAESIRSASATSSTASVTNADESVRPVDSITLEALCNSLSKLFSHADFINLGKNKAGVRIHEVVESYARLLYSHYTFAKNFSSDIISHPDIDFYLFVKSVFFTNGNRVLELPPLPSYPTSTDADHLLLKLLQVIQMATGDENVNKLLDFIVRKMVAQESKHQAYNVGKLRTIASALHDIDDMPDMHEAIPENEEMREDLFKGYDIGEDDDEDNINGEYE